MILILPECWFSRAIVFFLLDTAYCKLKQVFLKIRKISRKKKLKYHKEYILKISAQSIELLRNNSYDKFNDITWVSMLYVWEQKLVHKIFKVNLNPLLCICWSKAQLHLLNTSGYATTKS